MSEQGTELGLTFLSGTAACRTVTERALAADCWHKLGGESFQFVGEGATADLRGAFLERATRLRVLLEDLGFKTAYCTRSSPPDIYEPEDLENIDSDTWVRCAYAFEREIERHQDITRHEMPMLWALHAALEELELLWLDALKCEQGCYPLWWMAEEGRKLRAFRGLRGMGVYDQGEGGELLVRKLRESSGDELRSSAGELLVALQSRGAEFRQEWGAVYEEVAYALGKLVTETVIEVSPEERAEGLDDLRHYFGLLGMERAEAEGRLFPVSSLHEGHEDLPDAVEAWLVHVAAERDAAQQEAHVAGLIGSDDLTEDHPLVRLMQCHAMLLAIARSLRDAAFEEVVAAIAVPPTRPSEAEDEIPMDVDLVSSGAPANLTAASETCHEEGSATEEGTGAIDDASPGIETEVDPREAFAQASPLERLKRRMYLEVSDEDIDGLQSLIREVGASGIPRADRASWVTDVRLMLESSRLELFEAGSDKRLTLSLKNGSVRFGAGKTTYKLGDVAVDVRRKPAPTFRPRASQAKSPQAPSLE